jgi:hypothetical protein
MKTSRTFLLRAPLAGALLTLLAGFPPLRAADADDPAATTAVSDLDNTARKEGDTKVVTRLTSDFTKLAGSADNATALVQGLRDGTAVKLTSTVNGQTQTTTFTPATGKLGYGNVYIAVALAQAELTKAGITNPAAEQLQAALNGGTVTVGDKSVALAGVLTLRASGQGWGQIAKTLDVRLGEVVSSLRSARGQLERGERPENGNRADKPDKPALPEKAERPETPGRPDLPERVTRPEMPERAQRPERAGR